MLDVGNQRPGVVGADIVTVSQSGGETRSAGPQMRREDPLWLTEDASQRIDVMDGTVDEEEVGGQDIRIVLTTSLFQEVKPLTSENRVLHPAEHRLAIALLDLGRPAAAAGDVVVKHVEPVIGLQCCRFDVAQVT